MTVGDNSLSRPGMHRKREGDFATVIQGNSRFVVWKAPGMLTTPIGNRLADTIQKWRLLNHAYAGAIKRSCFSASDDCLKYR